MSVMFTSGIDIWKKKWLAVVFIDGRYEEGMVRSEVSELLDELADADAVGIDMPIGLTTGEEHREADGEARKFVGPRGSSVFPTYPREVYGAGSYKDACERCQELTGKSISRQAYAIGDRILELDVAIADKSNVYEVHPEVSFCAMAGRHITQSKTSWNGLHQRIDLLRNRGIEFPANLTDIGDAGAVDLLDAAAAAWSATRIAAGTADSLPSPPQIVDGKQVAIWY
jgi:predicted RNase H-like nuclease